MGNTKALTAKALCTISVRSANGLAHLNNLAEQLFADGIDPIELKCLSCGAEWERSDTSGWRDACCSNCYSDNVIITKVRLEFLNWGEQNGGEAQQRERFERAKEAYDRIVAKLSIAMEEIDD